MQKDFRRTDITFIDEMVTLQFNTENIKAAMEDDVDGIFLLQMHLYLDKVTHH